MGQFTDILNEDIFLSERKTHSIRKLEEARGEFKKIFTTCDITIFSAGSLGREEIGKSSDLDTFIISKDKINKLNEIKIFSKLIEVNDNLKYPEISNDGEHLNIHDIKEIMETLGSPDDDKQNMFTERMLLLLESKCLYEENIYGEIIDNIVELYFRDHNGTQTFKPLFLLNDILRYWRTLCLNFEQTRHNEARPWRKKNINLKYSRMLTIFATVFAIISKPLNTKEEIVELCKLTPMQRFAQGLDMLNDESLKDDYKAFLTYYGDFLEAKENGNIEKDLEAKKTLNSNAIHFSEFIYKVLNHEKINIEYRKYLII